MTSGREFDADAASAVVDLVGSVWADWPLPRPGHGADKEIRGRALVIAGSAEMPGAAVLAGIAALRAGAGKLVIATAARAAQTVAAEVPEAQVVALPETDDGAFAVEGVDKIRSALGHAGAVLIGPGMQGADGTEAFVHAALALTEAPVVLDALAMDGIESDLPRRSPLILTPHAGEMASLCGDSKEDVLAAPELTARRCAVRWNVVVALKGACTVIADPAGQAWRHVGGNAGLGTSGSGDVLAGIILGLLARGSEPAQAAAWGVALHARAGDVRALQNGPIGYLARELAAEVPSLMAQLAA